MKLKPQILLRKLHRWGSLFIALPFLVVIVSGVFLLFKKEVGWIQPPTQKGASKFPTISFDQILHAMKEVPEAAVSDWKDIDRVDLRPDQGSIKVYCKNRWEIQLDSHTAQVLQTAYRRSDLIESIHDGTWFHEHVKLWLFLPSALVVLGLWITGMYLFYLPYKARLARAKKTLKAEQAAVSVGTYSD
jgi:uncharacterized iron-regulated membrane protein